MALVITTTPPFAAQYATARSPPWMPHPEAWWMITPRPCAIIVGNAYLLISHAPLRLESTVASHSSSVQSTALCAIVDAGVVEQDVEPPAEGPQRLGHEALAVGGPCHVRSDEDRGTAGFRDGFRDLPAARLIAARHDHLCPFLGEEPRRRLAEARGGAGDDRDAVFELHGSRAGAYPSRGRDRPAAATSRNPGW